ncbi:uncharacterized protein K02A2.6-like [Temnothorax curvispinosus]|uniref:RNA-directed DNA polymerase n=1 Tax=Temnothorax curvispinosus TaxID=300111 RepID=A0A6J1R777_9HYME|nr:uncharacterized protein K02A2.6-like [Temnothorax curvispinosus]
MKMSDHRGISPMSMTGNIAENWKTWRSRFENYLVATEINKREEATQCAQLLHYIGEEGFRIYTTFTFSEAERNKIAVLFEKFEAHFLPKENLPYERYKFFSYRQQPGQTLEQFITELKQRAMKCKLGELHDSLVKTMIICGVSNSTIREQLLQKDELTLDKAIEQCIIIEMSKARSDAIEGVKTNGNSVDAINRRRNLHSNQHGGTTSGGKQGQRATTSTGGGNVKQTKTIIDCTKCGRSHAINKCPAYGKICNTCQIKNHFASQCFKNKNKVNKAENKVHEVGEVGNPEDYMFIGSIDVDAVDSKGTNKIPTGEWTTNVKIRGKEVNFKMDTGSRVNTLPLKTYNRLGFPKSVLKRTNVVLSAYTGDLLRIVGDCTIPCVIGKKSYNLQFFVIDTDKKPLLGLLTLIKLNLVQKIDEVESIDINYNKLINDNKELFVGIGCLKEPYRIELKEDATPVVHPARKVPVHIKDKLKESLDALEKQGIIEKVDYSTDWVNSLVIVRKPNGKLRICLDPQDLNKAIKREHCQIPTLEQITAELNGAKYFSTLDATNGFYQVQLDKESSDLCTFATPFGRYKFLRMPYGICSAPEVFQEKFKSIFDTEGSKVYIDDVIVWGKTKEEHDRRLVKVLQLAKENNVKFNLSKCKFGRTKIEYMGHIITDKGMYPNENKIRAIMEFQQPENKNDVQRLLGMLTYVSKFVKEFSDKTAPLRNLIKDNVEFIWLDEHTRALDEIKKILCKQPVLQFFDASKETVVSVDASKSGLGAVLMQNKLPCAYASKALTETQTRYAQIEKELLAICFGLTKFNEYVYGKRVIVETDHQPLVSIFKKPLNKCPARLQRMRLQLQKYDIDLRYRPGKELILADALSRAYVKEHNAAEWEEDIDAQVCLITCQINATPQKMKELVVETNKDEELIELKKVILSGWPKNEKKLSDSVKSYNQYKDELTIVSDLVFKGQSVVIPNSMRSEMLNRVHYSHLGVNKCLSIAQESIFWPGMINQIKQKIAECPLCLKYAKSQNREPLKSHEIPNLPWNKIGCDIFELKGKKYLLLIDYFSKYPEVAELESMTSNTIIKKMKSIFARHGIPRTVISDGGTQFTSKEFEQFTKEYEFDHIPSSPTYAQSNGMSERNIQTVKSMFKKALEEKSDLDLALLHYRNTPILGNVSPAEALMSRKLRSKLPYTNKMLKPKVATKQMAETVAKLQKSEQKYYNARNAKELPQIPDNSFVYVQRSPRSDWYPATILCQIRDRSYKVKLQNGSILVRNRRFIKLVKSPIVLKNAAKETKVLGKKEKRVEPKIYIEIVDNEVEPDPVVNDEVEPPGNRSSSNSDEFEDARMESESTGSDSEVESVNQTVRTASGRISKPPQRLNL